MLVKKEKLTEAIVDVDPSYDEVGDINIMREPQKKEGKYYDQT